MLLIFLEDLTLIIIIEVLLVVIVEVLIEALDSIQEDPLVADLKEEDNLALCAKSVVKLIT